MARSTGESRPWARYGAALLLSLLVNAAMVVAWVDYTSGWELGQWRAPMKVTVLEGDPLYTDRPATSSVDDRVTVLPREEEPTPPPVEEDPPLPDGQIVETPPPQEEKTPLEADYLAEHDNAVAEETRTAQFKINPEILANQYSEEERMELADSPEIAASRFSAGARTGGTDSDLAGKGAPRSKVPAEYSFSAQAGLDAPTAAASSRQSLAGAPQNDLLDEKLGRAVSLNTREFVGAAYLNRIRRQVNLYWDQCLQNLPSSVRFVRMSYHTDVDVVLSGEGALEHIEVTGESGLDPLDNCVVQAFRIAGPFPNPPEQLIRRDGRVYLPDMRFTVQISVSQMGYEGVDPRSGVQFPGILNSAR